MKRRVLITSASRKVSLVKAFKESGWEVHAQDINPDSPALYYADFYFSYPETNLDGESSTFAYARDCKIDLIVPTRDDELIKFQDYVEDFRISMPSKHTVAICVDKFKTYKFLKDGGFPTPEVYFVKPRYSQSRGSASPSKVWEHVWQENIEGEEMSIDLFADFDSTVISSVPRLRLKTVAGESWVSETVWNEEVLQESVRLARALKLVGHNVLQCFWNGKKAIWTDINCRFGGASALGIKAGCNSPKFLMSLLRGKRLKPCLGDYKVGLKMLRYTTDYFQEAA